MKKKEKLSVKKDAFLNRLASHMSNSSSHPYSKSHARRMKRKEREQVAGGLGDIQDAIGDLLGDEAPSETIAESNKKAAKRKQTDMEVEGGEDPKKTKTVQAGVIGQGKNTTLTKAQRKRALELERLRHPRILSNPAYSSNPFETIRTHAQNTLVKHQPA
ncbi:ribosome biogenesis protein SLX9-domain-containing protein [Pterulicium gracile]|uniref:Ribosome biogenesis protein SLX9 n=1 Tax=Pterulicium gracile TaxID=1884261 RepID=A0A5C3Q4Z2_9AGAR|nr:ribosome biogenesis protein SLX9-domain-containing protein [Pterula gracilis]